MAISRKPRASNIPESKVEALISKGGSSPARENPKDGVVPIILRLPSETVDEIQLLINAQRPRRIPRHTWILDAVFEKIARDKKTNKGFPE